MFVSATVVGTIATEPPVTATCAILRLPTVPSLKYTRTPSVTTLLTSDFGSPSSVSCVTASTIGTAGGRFSQKTRPAAIATATTPATIHTHRVVERAISLMAPTDFRLETGNASWTNESGQVVGTADLPGSQTHDAFLWDKGQMGGLGNPGQTSFAFAINSAGQVVGHSLTNDGTFHAFLWEDAGPMIDLNVFVPPGSSIQQLTDALNINDRGEIYGAGVPPGVPPEDVEALGHVFLLIPNGDCDDDCEQRLVESQHDQAAAAQFAQNLTLKPQPATSPAERVRSLMRERLHLYGQRAALRD